MDYISWAECVNWNAMKIQRKSNWKWYKWLELLKSLKDYIEEADNWKVKEQFIREFKEVRKCYNLFTITFTKEMWITRKYIKDTHFF